MLQAKISTYFYSLSVLFKQHLTAVLINRSNHINMKINPKPCIWWDKLFMKLKGQYNKMKQWFYIDFFQRNFAGGEDKQANAFPVMWGGWVGVESCTVEVAERLNRWERCQMFQRVWKLVIYNRVKHYFTHTDLYIQPAHFLPPPWLL